MAKAPKLTVQQKVELWRRWRQGQSLSESGRALDRTAPAIFSSVNHTGGFSPPIRKRSVRHLSLADREEISRGLASGKSLRDIAKAVEKSPSTIWREISRNSSPSGYRAVCADAKAWQRGKRPKPCMLRSNPRPRDVVAEKLAHNWSPERIAGYLKSTESESGLLSQETIYKSLFIQARNVLKRELCGYLRSRREFRRGRNSTTKRGVRGPIESGISISERPAEAADRAVAGHWEGDLIAGSKNSYIATLVERHSRFVILCHVTGKDTESVVKSLIREAIKLPIHLRRSLTWNRGSEMASYSNFTVTTNVKVFFCDPHNPWQRGSNENTNGLLRQYFPKGTCLSGFSQRHLDKVAYQLNGRARQTLDWKTPAEVLGCMLR